MYREIKQMFDNNFVKSFSGESIHYSCGRDVHKFLCTTLPFLASFCSGGLLDKAQRIKFYDQLLFSREREAVHDLLLGEECH